MTIVGVASIQCVDRVSGLTGDFIHLGDKKAISPIFDNLLALYKWMRQNGWEMEEWEITKDFNGRYVPLRVQKIVST